MGGWLPQDQSYAPLPAVTGQLQWTTVPEWTATAPISGGPAREKRRDTLTPQLSDIG